MIILTVWRKALMKDDFLDYEKQPKNVTTDSFIDELQQFAVNFSEKLPEPDPLLISEYRSYVDQMESKCAFLSSRFYELEEQTQRDTAQILYGSSGNLHRGYFCPSLVEDLLIGGVKRGRLIKKPDPDADSYFGYFFNQAGQLIKVEFYAFKKLNQTEYLVYDGLKIYGIDFNSFQLAENSDPMPSPEMMFNFVDGFSMEEYDAAGHLHMYVFTSISVVKDNGVSKLHCAFIHYSEKNTFDEAGKLEQVTTVDGFIKHEIILNQNRYQLIYEADGSISGFEIDGQFLQSRGKRKKRKAKSVNLVEALKRALEKSRFPQTLDLMAAIEAFEEVCRIKIVSESDDLLYETGEYTFTGETMYYFSLTRQFDTPETDDSEFMQLKLDILFAPDERLAAHCVIEWSDDDFADFFAMVRGSEILSLIQESAYRPIKYEVRMERT